MAELALLGPLESIRHLLLDMTEAEQVAFNIYHAMHRDYLASNLLVVWLPLNIGYSLNQQGILSIVCKDIVYVPLTSNHDAIVNAKLHSNTTGREGYIFFDTIRNAFRIGDSLMNDHEYPLQLLEVISIVEAAQPMQPVVANEVAINHEMEAVEAAPRELAAADADLLHLNDEPAFVAPRRRGVSKIPKPRNSWIIYRGDKHPEIVAQHPNLPTAEICKFLFSI